MPPDLPLSKQLLLHAGHDIQTAKTIRSGRTWRYGGGGMKFRGIVELHRKTATGISVPEEVVISLGGGKRPKVRITINGYTYRTSVGSMSGQLLLPVSAQVREGAAIAAGDEVDIDIELDTEPREVNVPADLAAALDHEPDARQAFDRMPYSHRLRYVTVIEDAKTPETRQRRIAKTISSLREG